jgi:hypothetical protein
MFLATINNQFDNKIRGLEVNKDVWAKVLQIVREPLIVPDKAKIPQWKFCSIKGEQRCTENIGSTNLMILDFDDSAYTIEEFESQFREYKYILHTSWSYDGTNSKFRVLLFLDKEYEINRLFFKGHDKTFSPYHYMLKAFPHIDPASFVKAQFFKMPAKKAPDAPYYFSIHKGKPWSPADIEGFTFAYTMCEMKQEEYIKKIDAENAKRRQRQPNQDMSTAIEYIKRKMNEMPAGMRHNGVFGLASWFAGIGGTYAEFSQIRPPWADKQYDKQIKRLANEWYKIGK